jgi:SAM-dependent methyltransferase
MRGPDTRESISMQSNLRSSVAQNGARIAIGPNGEIEIVTPPENWSYAAFVPFRQDGARPDDCARGTAIGILVRAELSVRRGRAGLFLTKKETGELLSLEEMIEAGADPQTVQLKTGDLAADALCIRSFDQGSAELMLYSVTARAVRRIDVTEIIDEVLPSLILKPGPAALTCIAEAITRRSGGPLQTEEIGAITCGRVPLRVPYEKMWRSVPEGSIIVRETEKLTDLLSTYNPAAMGPFPGDVTAQYNAKYFRQNTIRVYHAVDLLRSSEITGKSVLEIGSLFGTFAVPLRRLGYDVTAVDRYDHFRNAMPGHIDYMKSIGIRVVETDEDNEARVVASLGEFDIVICMAVIEHIPHTPKYFLQMLAEHVCKQGILLIDTPNVARYWNRKAISEGRSPYQNIDSQFNSKIPFEGHHREYTLVELIWMVSQIGFHDVKHRQFDYNILQYEHLSRGHIEALMNMTIDPSNTDTIMVAGRK